MPSDAFTSVSPPLCGGSAGVRCRSVAGCARPNETPAERGANGWRGVSSVCWIGTALVASAMLFTATAVRADVPPSNGPQTAADAEDAYADAAQQLRSADAAVVRARQQAVATYRSTPAYTAAAAAVDAAFDAYAEKRNALLTTAEQHDPRYGPLKREAAGKDAEIAAAGQNPAVSAEQFGVLLGEREVVVKQLATLEEDVIDRDPDAKRLRQQWTDACAKLRELQDGQPAAVEATPDVRAALATAATVRATVERSRGALAAPATADAAEPAADEFVRRYPRYGLGWNDAWLTYGTPPATGK
jgi:hypothetical protein